MFKSVRLVNFFSFEDEKIDLHQGVNLLVGINGSGKSNLLRAFELLEAGMRQQLASKISEWRGFDEIIHKGHAKKKNREGISLRFDFSPSTFQNQDIPKTLEWANLSYNILIKRKQGEGYQLYESLDVEYVEFEGGFSTVLKSTPNNHWIGAGQSVSKNETYELLLPQLGVSAPEELNFMSELLKREIAVYNYFNTFPDSPMRKSHLVEGIKRLQNYGDNLSQILNEIKIKDRQSYAQLLEKIQEVNPNIEGLDFRHYSAGSLEILLEERGLQSVVYSSSISDGTLRFLCMASIAFNNHRGRIVCIEEPEIGLHPDMIIEISHMLDHAAFEGSQLLISTHSAQLLDLYYLENIMVFEKNEANSTVVHRLSEDDFKGWRDQFEAGKMWRAGDFGGNRW